MISDFYIHKQWEMHCLHYEYEKIGEKISNTKCGNNDKQHEKNLWYIAKKCPSQTWESAFSSTGVLGKSVTYLQQIDRY